MRTRLQAFRRATEYTDDRTKEEFVTLGEEVSLCRLLIVATSPLFTVTGDGGAEEQ